MQHMNTSQRQAAPAAIAGENVGPDSAAGPVVTGFAKRESPFQARRWSGRRGDARIEKGGARPPALRGARKLWKKVK